MIYSVMFTKQAVKALRKLPAEAIETINKKIEELSTNPFSPHLDIGKLQGRDGYRLRIGNYRVIYDLFEHQLLIIVIKIGNRKEVYK